MVRASYGIMDHREKRTASAAPSRNVAVGASELGLGPRDVSGEEVAYLHDGAARGITISVD
jgi:hypothetical protein